MTDSIRVFDPGFRVTDTSGNPVSGAKIKFYNADGFVARTVYSDSGLSTSLGSTVTCDSAGAPAASGGDGGKVLIYTGTTAFKVVITDSSDVTLHEFDNISGALDTSSFSEDTALPRTPVISKSSDYVIVDGDRGKIVNCNPTGGAIAITLPSAITVGDNWRVTIRHVGTANAVTISASGGQTINGASSQTLSYQYEGITLCSDGANWHITEDGLLRRPAGVVLPQGYLTPSSTTAILTGSDVSAATAIYYTPYVGNLIPLYDGTRFIPYEFSQLTLTLVSQHLADTIYDVFAFLDGTTVRIGTGPAWSNSGSASGSRGFGAGTTAVARLLGVILNSFAITARNGTDTYSVGAARATYLGSILIDDSAGQVTCHRTYGQSRKWGVWNAYNRRPIILLAGDTTASWSHNSTFRPANNDTANSLKVFTGLSEEFVEVTVNNVASGTSGTSATSRVGVGWNSTTAASGYAPSLSTRVDSLAVAQNLHARHVNTPFLGMVTVTALESATDTTTFKGGLDEMVMTAKYMG